MKVRLNASRNHVILVKHIMDHGGRITLQRLYLNYPANWLEDALRRIVRKGWLRLEQSHYIVTREAWDFFADREELLREHKKYNQHRTCK